VVEVDRDNDFLLPFGKPIAPLAMVSERLCRYASSEDELMPFAGIVCAFVVGVPSDCLLFRSGWVVVEATLLCPGRAPDLDLDLDLVTAERDRDRDKAGRGVTDRIVAISGLGTRGD